jgi:hypothetical protein
MAPSCFHPAKTPKLEIEIRSSKSEPSKADTRNLKPFAFCSLITDHSSSPTSPNPTFQEPFSFTRARFSMTKRKL